MSLIFNEKKNDLHEYLFYLEMKNTEDVNFQKLFDNCQKNNENNIKKVENKIFQNVSLLKTIQIA